MKKVKMLSALVFGNNFSLQPRQIIELEDNKADEFIKKNLAVLIEEVKETVEIEEVKETVEIEEEKVEKKPKRTRKKKDEV